MENNNLNNLPPFYIGQKVVYITGERMLKNSTHTVTGIKKRNCGCWSISIDSFNIPSITGKFRCILHINCNWVDDGISWKATSFRPYKEQSFPLLTYIKILEEVPVSAN